MRLVIRDAMVTIKPADPNNKETIILKNATVVTKTKDPKGGNTIKIKPLEESTISIEFGERRML